MLVLRKKNSNDVNKSKKTRHSCANIKEDINKSDKSTYFKKMRSEEHGGLLDQVAKRKPTKKMKFRDD
jgi:hypothetical protein